MDVLPADGSSPGSSGTTVSTSAPAAAAPAAWPQLDQPAGSAAGRRPQLQHQDHTLERAATDAAGAEVREVAHTAGRVAAGRAAPAMTAEVLRVRRCETAVAIWGVSNQLYHHYSAHAAHALTSSQHLWQLFLVSTRLGTLLVGHALPLATWMQLR